jgi:hypothetical protein
MSAPKKRKKRLSKRAVVLVTVAAVLAAIGVLHEAVPTSLELLWTYVGNR